MNKNTQKLLLAMALLGTSTSYAQTLWNVSTGGNWDTAGNWNPGTVPNAIDADARITNLTAVGAYSINASSAQNFTVGRLDFGTNGSAVDLDMTLASNVGLIFDVTSGNAQLNLATGGTGSTMVINSAIQLNDNLTLTSVRNGSNQVVAQFTGAVNLQGNTWTINNSAQGLRLDSLISGTGALTIANDSGSQRTTQFTNTGSTYSGGTTVGRNNTLQLGSGTSTTGTGGGGILGSGTITVAAGSTLNDGNAATLQSNGAFPANDADTAVNVLTNNINVATGRVLRIDTSRVLNYTGTLSGAGTIVKTTGNSGGSRAFAINVTNTGFTGVVEIQDGQLNTRVTDALGSSATIRFNPTSNTNGVGLFGSTTSGTDVSIGSTLDFQRTASGNSQFITTAGNSIFTLSGNFSNSGTGTAGYIGLGRGNGVLTNVGGGYALGSNTGIATIRLTGTGSLDNNIGIVNGSTATSALSLGNTTGTQTFTGIVSGNGALIRNGAGGVTKLSGINTYSGTTTVTAGTLLVNGTHGAASAVGAYIVDGGTLGGTGTIKAASAAVAAITVSNSGVISAGDAGIGTLTLDGGNTTGALLSMGAGTSFSFDLGAANTSDLVRFFNYAGASDFARSGTVSLNFTGAQAGTYNLFSFFSDTGTSVAATGISSGLTLGTGLTGFDATINYNTNDISLTLVASAIPEPSTFAALTGLGALGLAALRRRRAA